VSKPDRARIGDAGEYMAAAELTLRGWTVDMARRGARGVDLYAQHPSDGRVCAVQVKTRTGKDFTFDAGFLELVDPDADTWVILATFQPPEPWRFTILPRNHAGAAVIAFNAYYDSQGKVWGRKLLGPQEFVGYDDAWELMDASARRAPWRMPAWVEDELRARGHKEVLAAVKRRVGR
jgi:Holliday junction resolvase-like predicted endonuclease